MTGVNVARFAEGKSAESWFNFDMLSLLQQIGAVPTPEQWWQLSVQRLSRHILAPIGKGRPNTRCSGRAGACALM